MRVGLVVPRYGREIDGGAETLAREVATRLASEIAVEVFTTTATDYLSWRNVLPVGTEALDGVTVHRHRVATPRRIRSFGRLSERLYHRAHSIEDETSWMVRQGPRSLELLEHLEDRRNDLSAVLFVPYLYYTTYFGLPLVADRSVLVPALHDEPPARFTIFRSVFQLPRAFVWNTPEERAFAEDRFRVRAPGRVAGYGVEPPKAVDRDAFRRRHGIGDYLLYLGRIDVLKGIPELLEGHRRLRSGRSPSPSLVLAGRSHMRIPRGSDVLEVGFLSESEKWEALAGASALVLPSAFESLSVVALEAWAVGTPVVAKDVSAAVAGQCRRSGAGVLFGDSGSFEDAVARALTDDGRRAGAAGREFVAKHCRWDRVIAAYREAIEIASGDRAE